MLYIIEDAINGILMGSIYGLTALGLTIIFGVLKVINFAHGSLLMVGMYVTYWTVALSGVHPYLALVVVIPVMFFFGYYLQDLVIKPIFKAEKDVREPVTVIIVTTGVWYILDNVALLFFGPQYRSIHNNPLQGKMLEIGDMLISVPKVWGCLTAIVTAVGIYYFFNIPAWAGPSGPPAWIVTLQALWVSINTGFTISPLALARPFPVSPPSP